jgi:hypothetical protein
VGLDASWAHSQPKRSAAPEAAALAPEAPAQPEVIPVPEISLAARATDERLRSIEAQLVLTAEVERIFEQREPYPSELANAIEGLTDLRAASPSRSRLAHAKKR